MDTSALLEYIKWVEKLISSQHHYYETKHIDQFAKWMEVEEIVKFIGKYLREEMEKKINQEIYEINLN